VVYIKDGACESNLSDWVVIIVIEGFVRAGCCSGVVSVDCVYGIEMGLSWVSDRMVGGTCKMGSFSQLVEIEYCNWNPFVRCW